MYFILNELLLSKLKRKKGRFSNAGKLQTLGQLKKTNVIICWKAAGSTETQQEILIQNSL